MLVTERVYNRNSVDEYADRLLSLFNSGTSVIHVRSDETTRAQLATRTIAVRNGCKLVEWDVLSGLKNIDGTNYDELVVGGDALTGPLAAALGRILDDETQSAVVNSNEDGAYTVYVMVNPHPFLEGPAVAAHILRIAHCFTYLPARLVLITPEITQPTYLHSISHTLRLEPPGPTELRDAASAILEIGGTSGGMEDDSMNRLCYAGAGMAMTAFENALSLAVVDLTADGGDEALDMDALIAEVSRAKTEVVKRNELLELFPAEDMSNVGGMHRVKDWVSKRRGCYTDEAAAFGVEPPKGVVFVGPPGCGKSLIAKAVSKEFGVPLVRLDFGRVYNSLVGASEERMRTALRMVEYMAPVVLFVDEIDKGLGGSGGGDGGTSMRVLGTFLTWLQECKAPVFTLVTANNVMGLPPEVLRRGRFDAIFGSHMPTDAERREVLEIHLRKRNRSLPEADIARIAELTVGFVPAEIEAAVKDGLVAAFSAGEEFSTRHVTQAIRDIVPLSKSHSEEIALTIAWVTANAIPASYAEEEKPNPTTPKGGGKVRSLGSRRVSRSKG